MIQLTDVIDDEGKAHCHLYKNAKEVIAVGFDEAKTVIFTETSCIRYEPEINTCMECSGYGC